MRLRDTVTSKWFRVDDLPGGKDGALCVTIARIGMSRYSDGRESVDLYFHETPKPLGCNTTNRKRLLAMFGEDIQLDDLVGRRIELYAELTQDTTGNPVWGIRIRPPMMSIQQSSMAARERINAAREHYSQPQTATSAPRRRPDQVSRPAQNRPPAPPSPQEPAHFNDPQDPGPLGIDADYNQEAGF